MHQVQTYVRTHYEAVLDVRYAIHWNELNERLNRHFDAALKILSLVFGTTAFGAYLATYPQVSAYAGLFMAVVTVLDVVLAPC
jgi:hypothetical protein